MKKADFSTHEDREFQDRIKRIEILIQEIDNFTDPKAIENTKDLIQLLMKFNGAGIERIVNIISDAGKSGTEILGKLSGDDLVMNLLLLYNLHPKNLNTRVHEALEKVRPYLNSHGGNVELLGVDEESGVVRLKLKGSCESCPSSAMTLKLAIEDAIYEAAPDVMKIEAEGVAQQQKSGEVSFKGKLKNKSKINKNLNSRADKISLNNNGLEANSWVEIDGSESLNDGSIRAMEVSGNSILLCRLLETFYAYGNICPNCDQTLDKAHLELSSIVCPHCWQKFDAIRAGRGLDNPSQYLQPIPLLVDNNRAKITLPNINNTEVVK